MLFRSMLLDKMKLKEKHLVNREMLLEFLKNKKLEVLLTMGAGDIDTVVEPIERMLKERIK